MPSLDLSPAELLDRKSILELKIRYAPPEKRDDLARAMQAVIRALRTIDTSRVQSDLDALDAELARINTEIWDLEDDIRRYLRQERQGEPNFVYLTAQVPVLNDQRAACKARIDKLLDYGVSDIKVYGV
jgi:chromosome segregation ATPase